MTNLQTRKAYIEILQQLQNEIYPQLKKCWGFHPWAIIQNKVGYFLHMIANGKYKEDDFTNYKRIYFSRKMRRTDVKRFLKLWRRVYRLKKKWKNVLRDHTLFISWHSNLNGKNENIYIHPMIKLLDKENKPSVILHMGTTTFEPDSITGFYQQLLEYHKLKLKIKAYFFNPIPAVLHNSRLVQDFFERSNSKFSDGIAHNIYWSIIHHQNAFDAFSTLLKTTKPELVWLYCYYGQESFIRAANKCRVKLVEYQHSAFSSDHFAYTKWKNIDDYSEHFPPLFWTWNKQSKQIILENFTGKRYRPKVLCGGNLYIREQKENLQAIAINAENRKNKILVCLQGRWIPHFIEKFILDHPDYFWYIRLHPRYPEDKSRMDDLKQKIPDRIETEQANALPLYELFLKVSFNLTAFSGTAIEAPEFGVQTIIFGEDGFSQFNEQIHAGLFKYVKTEKDLQEALTTPNQIVTSNENDATVWHELYAAKK